MSESLELQRDVTPMQMIHVAFDAAIKQGSAMEVVNLILEQQRWLIRHTEEENFNAALRRIQDKLQAIQKRGWNESTSSHFATSFDIHNAIKPLLEAERMTLSFRPGVSDKPEMVLVIGLLSLGAFEKEYPLEMPADGKGAKGGGIMSRTHATGSALKYAKRYLKDMIFDLNTKGPKDDDDGNGGGVKIPSEKVGEWLKSLGESTDLTAHMKLWGKIYTTANELGDKNALDILIPAYETKKSELSGAQ
jgi:hypothetical protein